MMSRMLSKPVASPPNRGFIEHDNTFSLASDSPRNSTLNCGRRLSRILPTPAHYTRNLMIYTSQALTSEGCIRAFSGLVRLQVDVRGKSTYSLLYGDGEKISFVPLRGLSPTLKSLHLSCSFSAPTSEIFGLVCSFPLLEDLSLVCPGSSEDDRWDTPLTSPRFTGCLDLDMIGEIGPAVRRLSELPSGLHFSRISMTCYDNDVELTMDLLSKCSDTLEYLGICYRPGAFIYLLASAVG